MKSAEPLVRAKVSSPLNVEKSQKLIAGFLVEGYSRDKLSKPYAIAKEIQTALQSAGLHLPDDTIVNWIKEAAALVTPAGINPAESK